MRPGAGWLLAFGAAFAALAFSAMERPAPDAGCPYPDAACMEGAGELEALGPAACEPGEAWSVEAGCVEGRGDEPVALVIMR